MKALAYPEDAPPGDSMEIQTR